jgi:TolB protein
VEKTARSSRFWGVLALTVLVGAVCIILVYTLGREEPAPVAPPEKTGAETFSICTDASYHYDPRISGNFVVWEDGRNGNSNIYGFDLLAKSDFPICIIEGEQEYAAISGNIVIWVYHRDGTGIYDIYGYNLSNKAEFTITTVRNPTGPWRGPDIGGDVVVWEDDDEGYWEKYGYDIRGYSLTTGRQFPICVAPSSQECPRISNNIVVWTDFRNGNGDIYSYDLSTETEFPICTNEAYQGWADICGSIVVWEDERNGNSDIYGYNISTGTEFPICTDLHTQAKPRVSGNIVVWEDERHSWWEEELNYWFYGYDLSARREFPIARYDAIFGMALQDFDGDIIVYYDMEGGGSWKIMGLRLP